jgi:hypothetical protein
VGWLASESGGVSHEKGAKLGISQERDAHDGRITGDDDLGANWANGLIVRGEQDLSDRGVGVGNPDQLPRDKEIEAAAAFDADPPDCSVLVGVGRVDAMYEVGAHADMIEWQADMSKGLPIRPVVG